MSADAGLPRVLLITGRADIGGGPEHVLQLTEGLAGRCQLFIACPHEAPYWERYQARVGAGRMLAIPKRALTAGALWNLGRFVRRQRIQLLHSHGNAGSIYSRLVGVATGVPVVHTHHGLFFVSQPAGIKRSLRLVIERLLERVTALSIFVSGADQALARSAGFDRGPSRTIQNGVVVPATVDPRPRLPGTPLRIATVNYYNEAKNPALLLAVIAELAARRSPDSEVEIHIYGDSAGDGRAQFAAQLRAAGHDHFVSQHGAVPNLRERLPGHDVFLSCSRWEGLPYAVLEAMAAGLPTVLSQVPGHNEILASGADQGFDEHGYPLDDPASAADRLLALRDDAPRHLAGVRAQAVVRRHFGVGTMLDQTFAGYRTVLEQHDTEWQPDA